MPTLPLNQVFVLESFPVHCLNNGIYLLDRGERADVVPSRILIYIALKALFAHLAVNSSEPSFEHKPKGLYALRVV